MTTYQVNKERVHLLLERPGMADIIEGQGGLKDSYTGSELLRMLFPKEVNDLIDAGVLIGPYVGKNDNATKKGLTQRVIERRERLKTFLDAYFDGTVPDASQVYELLNSPEHKFKRREIYPSGMQHIQVARDLQAIREMPAM